MLDYDIDITKKRIGSDRRNPIDISLFQCARWKADAKKVADQAKWAIDFQVMDFHIILRQISSYEYLTPDGFDPHNIDAPTDKRIQRELSAFGSSYDDIGGGCTAIEGYPTAKGSHINARCKMLVGPMSSLKRLVEGLMSGEEWQKVILTTDREYGPMLNHLDQIMRELSGGATTPAENDHFKAGTWKKSFWIEVKNPALLFNTLQLIMGDQFIDLGFYDCETDPYSFPYTGSRHERSYNIYEYILDNIHLEKLQKDLMNSGATKLDPIAKYSEMAQMAADLRNLTPSDGKGTIHYPDWDDYRTNLVIPKMVVWAARFGNLIGQSLVDLEWPVRDFDQRREEQYDMAGVAAECAYLIIDGIAVRLVEALDNVDEKGRVPEDTQQVLRDLNKQFLALALGCAATSKRVKNAHNPLSNAYYKPNIHVGLTAHRMARLADQNLQAD